MRIYLMTVLMMALGFSACVQNKKGANTETGTTANANVFEVKEVIQASSYSYLKVSENSSEKWMAVSKQEIEPGAVYYYDSALEMNNFKSKDLDRTFDVIYFVNQISKTPIGNGTMEQGHIMPPHSGKVETEKKSTVEFTKKDNEISLNQVFTDPAKFTENDFEIRGVVVKVNKEIMGKNWIHIQDGTDHNDKYDLTITTHETAEVGDVVTFKGKLTLDKDFGAGYYYELIMQDAELVNKTKTGTQL